MSDKPNYSIIRTENQSCSAFNTTYNFVKILFSTFKSWFRLYCALSSEPGYSPAEFAKPNVIETEHYMVKAT